MLFYPIRPESNLVCLPISLAEQASLCLLRELSHKLKAGFPSPATDYVEESLDLNAYLVTNKAATFVFQVKGDSMIGAGIHDGDKVIVDRSINAAHDDIVAAVVDGEYTLKRLFKRAGRIELRPENPLFSPIVFNAGIELQIWGVVTGSIRRYRQQAKPKSTRSVRG
jgi:DNA polymerase V